MAKKAPKSTVPLCIGIDVAADTLVVAARTLKGEVSHHEFKNDAAGIQRLVALAKAGKRPRRVVLEATGTYSLEASLALHDAKVQVMVLNPIVSARYAETLMWRAKTDIIDAEILLDYAERMAFVPWEPPSRSLRELRSIALRIQAINVQRTAELNRLHAAMRDPHVAPEVLDDLKATIRDLKQRVRALHDAAMKRIAADAELREAHAIVTSVCGIADRTAIHLLAHLLALPKDMTPRQIVAHFGLDPRTTKSGSSVRPTIHISRRGNPALRGAMYMPTLVACSHEPTVSAAYERLVERGKPKKVAQVAIMRRLLQSLWKMLTMKVKWDPSKFGTVSQAA